MINMAANVFADRKQALYKGLKEYLTQLQVSYTAEELQYVSKQNHSG